MKKISQLKMGILKISVLAFAIFLVSSQISCEKEKPAPIIRPVKTIVVGGSQAKDERSFSGQVEAWQDAELSFQVAGKLNKFPVKEGQAFKQGEVIGQLDARDFEQGLVSKKAMREKAKQDLERYKQLYAKDAVGLADLQSKERNFEVTNADYKIAEKKVEDAKLIAPFDGVVARKLVEEHQEVQAKQPIVRFQDTTKLKIKIDVPESLVAQSKGKGKVNFVAVFDNLPGKTFKLTPSEFGSQADPVTRTFPITFIVDEQMEANILPGMTAQVNADMSAFGDAPATVAFSVPVSAVFTDSQGKQSVWIVNKETMTVHQQSIEAGKMLKDKIQIKSGLKGGEIIVTAGTHVLQEGMKVRLLEEQPK